MNRLTALACSSAAGFLLLCGPASAAETASPWQGAYVGVHAGALIQDGSLNLAPTGDTPPDAALNPDLGGKGFVGGLLAGYDFAMQGFVLGVEGDIGFGSIDSVVLSDKATVPMSVWYATNRVKQDIGGHARIRLGLPLGSTLLYASGGLAVTSLKLNVIGYCPPDSPYTGEASKTLLGGSVGAGVEFPISASLTGRAEYLHDFYGDETLVPSVDQPYGNWQNRELSLGSNSFRVAVSYRF